MATKRSLYQPVPKTMISDKKTRKPLVQGRLVTDDTHFNNRESQLVQGELVVREDSTDDPTIQPVKSLPMLTENMSPRPERLHSLDLSDTDIDVMDFSHMNRPKPVMVFDASQLGDSPHGAEVDVVVAYENSPAKVICHTPGKLERSFRAKMYANQSLAQAGGDCPDLHVKVDRVQNYSDCLSRSAQSYHSLLLGDKESLKKMKEERNGSEESPGHYISHQSRGIIEEILVQELGTSNMEAISLNSETSPLSHQHPESSAQFSKKSQHQVSGRESEKTDLMANSSSMKGFSQNRQNKNKSSSFPQPKFEDESDASTDLVPVKDNIQNQQAGLNIENSDSETCSLHEYVTPKKQVGFDKKVTVTLKNVQDSEQPEAPLSVKKKKMRKVPSRYLLGSVNKSGNQSILPSKNVTLQSTSQSKSNTRSQTNAPPAGKQSREKQVLEGRSCVRPKKSALGKGSKTTSVLTTKTADVQRKEPIIIPAVQSFVTQMESPQETARSSTFPNSEQKTSTPTHDQICHLSQDIDASAIHSMSTVSMNMSVASVPQSYPANKINKDSNFKLLTSERLSTKKSTNRPPTQVDAQGPSQLQLDLQYSRYLQWAFLNSKAKKMFQEQEKSALAQMHALWQLVESKRDENTQLKLDVARLKRINLLDCILDKTESDLESLTSIIPQLGEDYSKLASALDITRHHLPTKDIYIPQGSQDEQDVHEEKLETTLRESEQLLVELSALTSDKLVPLSQYLDGVEAIDKNVSATHKELQDSQKDVTSLKGLTTRLTSLCIQDMQVQ